MEMSQSEGVGYARERMKKEAGLQIRLAKQLYGTEDAEAAMREWTDMPEGGPSDLFRRYLEAHPEMDLETREPSVLNRILEEAGIRPTIH